MSAARRVIALVPAAGVGARFGADRPKQYTQIGTDTVLNHTLRRLCRCDEIDQVAVVLSPQDAYFATMALQHPKLWPVFCGGDSRAETVRNGLLALQDQQGAADGDWVLVHDAARCCLPPEALQRLFQAAWSHEVGALLALPVADTLKRANGTHEVAATVDRRGLWQAQTPQMFRLGLLLRALQQADLNLVTDEASALEQLGLAPLLVPGDNRNIKLTLPQDERLVAWLLQAEQGLDGL